MNPFRACSGIFSLLLLAARLSVPTAAESSVTPDDARQKWAFQTPRPVVPPAVENRAWIQNEIDRFILARLEEKDIAPASPADKRTLIRRATFDLTGLPPTPEAVTAFLADDSPEAFSRVVERLLSSPAYGIRWARHWLDVVRYTDSFDSRGIGGEADVAEAYRYRDWVVRAFNDDLPYDQFVKQQIAGDILASRSNGSFDTNALIATGMYVIGEWGIGDADKEKMLTDIVDDQIDVTGRAFLGLTLACARCHDHKFDPISARDYYSMAGIFFSSHILPNPGVKTAGSPVLRVPIASPAEVERRKEMEARIAALGGELDKKLDEAIARVAVASLEETAEILEALHAAKSQREPENSLDNPASDAWREVLGWGEPESLSKFERDIAGKKGVHAWRLEAGPDTPSVTINSTGEDVAIGTLTLPPRSVSMHPSPRGGVGVAWKSPVDGPVIIAGAVVDSDDKCGDGFAWLLRHQTGGGETVLASGDASNGAKADIPRTTVQVSIDDRVELVIQPKGGYECDTTTVSLDLAEVEGTGLAWNLAHDVLSAEGRHPVADQHDHPAVWSFHAIGGSKRFEPGEGSLLGRWLAAEGPEDRARLAGELEQELVSFAQGEGKERNKNHPGFSLFQFITDPRGPAWAGLRKESHKLPENDRRDLEQLRAERGRLQASLPGPFAVTHALQEGGTPESAHAGFADARVHVRGSYTRLGDEVPRGFPVVLAGENQPRIEQGSGRLELARWIASPENPLTARVMVNRIWQHHFGEGLVRTPNNFGKLGTPPTHPQLLDYLANEFVKSGWSVKEMHRRIMLSATYQQSSRAEPAAMEADQENELFGRMNRRRLESEAIRDSLLWAGGTLDQALGGPAVRELANTRRTLYLMTIRSDRATYQSLFDAADPAAIIEKRTDSTVAPQALFLMNHPFVIAQAEALASRLEQISADPRARIEWLHELLYARPAAEVEIALGTLAANEGGWPAYCQVLLCANEFIYID